MSAPKALPTEPPPVTVTLSDGRVITLREPKAGELRGIKLVDVLQMDAAAHAPLVDRISDLTAAEFYALSGFDTMNIMSEIVLFFATAKTRADVDSQRA